MSRVRVALTFEQCWRRSPGGTGVAAVELGRALSARDDVDVVGVVGRHRRPATAGYEPTVDVRQLPVGGPMLIESSLRFGWPRVERATGAIDVLHATSIIPFATSSSVPLVVTVHDVAFLHHPHYFTARGRSVFARSLAVVRRRATLVLCSSRSTLDDCVANGFDERRLRLVPLGVRSRATSPNDVARVRATYALPDEYLLFVGTLEPRKNLPRLLDAHAQLGSSVPPLVVAGGVGWGSDDLAARLVGSPNVRFVGHVADADLPAVYAGASVMCYPSLMEGFGLPILEAMSQGTAVVTSIGTSTEEVAGGAAVLVDPRDTGSIADGIRDALVRRRELSQRGIERASAATWDVTAELVARAYDDAVAMGAR
ncbi:MAG: glycosyltransferase family 4 protein [Ilumatobacteraceae bacterium]